MAENEICFLTIEQASDFLNIKISKLRREVFLRRIRHFKFGALIRFKKEDLLKWVEEKIVDPIAPFSAKGPFRI